MNFSHRRPRSLQAIKLGSIIFVFKMICTLKESIDYSLAKKGHTRKGELTVYVLGAIQCEIVLTYMFRKQQLQYYVFLAFSMEVK